MSEFKTWEQMSEVEQLCAIHYDMYKDVYGFRPRHFNYDSISLEEIKEELNFLNREMVRVMNEEKILQDEAIAKFENRVTMTIESGAGDRETAIRWLFDAEDDSGYMAADPDYFCYCNGLPYGYFSKAA